MKRVAEHAIVPALFVLAFWALSLFPWRHLVGADYALQFGAFAVALGLVATAIAAGLARLRGRRSPAVALLVSLLLFVPTWFFNRAPDPNVVLLHLDSLRAANCSAYGYERPTTPNLERLAAEGAVLFERFFAQSAGTDKSTPAMLASIYPSMFFDPEHDDWGFRVPSRFPLLSERLAEVGYTCWGLSSNPQVSVVRNYDRGFHRFEQRWTNPRPHEVVQHMKETIAAGPAGPFFYYGLILDPHAPYQPGERFHRFAEDTAPTRAEVSEPPRRGEPPKRPASAAMDRYDGEILEVDAAVGELVEWLEATNRLEHTMLIVTSDHGEKFMEHGESGHGGTLYEEVVHVPLIWTFPSPFRFPPLRPNLERYTGLASHVDLMPTVLAFLGLEGSEAMRGESLLPYLYRGVTPPDRRILMEELVPGRAIRALRTERWKAMNEESNGKVVSRFLIDLEQHPDERVRIQEEDDTDGVLSTLLAEMDAMVREARTFYERSQSVPALDPETRQRLRSLGYER